MQQKMRIGTVGAILDEYALVINDLKKTIKKISSEDLKKIVDPNTRDTNCRTIQGILSHVVICGYYYVIRILKNKYPNKEFVFPKMVLLDKISDYNKALDEMYEFTEKNIINLKEREMRTVNPGKMIKTGWGWYDYEQILEHGIVHISRHRRQIKKFMMMLKEG